MPTFTTQNRADGLSVLPVVGRVLMAAIFLISGFGKLMSPDATIQYIASTGLPLPQIGFALAVIVEIVGGLALILGYRTRIVAAILAVFSLATAVFFHAQFGDQNQLIHFLKNVTMAGGFLQIVAFGAGRFSLDARRAAHE